MASVARGRAASPEDQDGTELQLALNNNPAAKAYQQAMFQQGQPAAMFFTDDVQADYERMKARGAEFTMPPSSLPEVVCDHDVAFPGVQVIRQDPATIARDRQTRRLEAGQPEWEGRHAADTAIDEVVQRERVAFAVRSRQRRIGREKDDAAISDVPRSGPYA